MTYGDYPNWQNAKKILVIKHRHLGDVLLTGPVFTTLKRALPKAQIDAYVYAESIPMLEGHPAICRFYGYNRAWKKKGVLHRLYQEWNLLRQIRKQQYDLVINLTEGDRGIIAARASKAPIRVGFEPKGKRQKKLLTHIAKHCPTLRHTVERNLDVLRRIGIFPEFEDRELFLHIPESAKTAVAQSTSYILIHPTSRWRFKCWPIDKMRSLIEQLLLKGKKIILSSGPDPIELEMVQAIAKDLDVLNLGGKVSLKELGALIEQAELLLCVDSVPFHMANALKKPVVALFGPTSEVTWGPWRNPHAKIVAQNFSCRPCYQDGCGGSKYSDCLYTLSVESVLKVLSEISLSRLRMRDELLHRTCC